jgi:hypothetical protein
MYGAVADKTLLVSPESCIDVSFIDNDDVGGGVQSRVKAN